MKEPETSTAETPTLSWRAAIDFKKLKEDPAAAQATAEKERLRARVEKYGHSTVNGKFTG